MKDKPNKTFKLSGSNLPPSGKTPDICTKCQWNEKCNHTSNDLTECFLPIEEIE